MKNRLVLTLALLTLTLPAAADIYRWVDAQGRVYYSDRPVPGAERISDIVSRPSDPQVIAERTAAEREQREQNQAVTQDEQKTAAAARGVEQDLVKLDAQRCKQAREDYRVATESQRLYRLGKDGEREYLTAAEITEARINARKTLDDACGKQGG